MADVREYIFLFLVWLISTTLLRILFIKRTSNHPPGPLALPIIGHLHLLAPSPHKAFYKFSQRYGSLFRVFLGSIPCVVASSPDTAREFLKTHEISFSNRPRTAAVHYLTYDLKDFAYAPYGPYWKFMKKLYMSELLCGRTLDRLLPVRQDELKRLIQSLARNAKAGKAVEIRGELINMTNNVISRMIMSTRCYGQENEAGKVRKLVEEASKVWGKLNLSDLFWFCKNLDLQGFPKKLKSIRDRFDEMMNKIIEKHREVRRNRKLLGDDVEAVVRDLLDILMDISEDETSEFRLTNENIKAFILDVFIGGTDTSAIAIEWALAELINHPNIMEKARREIDLVVGKHRLVEESDIPKLSYLQAIVKETLRLHPAGGPFVARESTEDTRIGGYHIPAKTRLLVNVWAIGRDPSYWENPLEYQPERFITEEGSLKSQLDVRGQNYYFLPFGSGRRVCPGISLALQLVQTSLAAVIQCFEWNVDCAVNMEEGPPTSILPMAHPLVSLPVARLSPLQPI